MGHESHSVEVRAATVYKPGEQPLLRVLILCNECQSQEEFTIRLFHAPMLNSSLAGILRSEGLTLAPRALYTNKSDFVKEGDTISDAEISAALHNEEGTKH